MAVLPNEEHKTAVRDEAEEHVVMRRAAGGDNGWSSDRHWDGCAGQTASHLPVLTD